MSTLPTGPWTVAKSDHNGRLLFIRINTGLRDLAGKPPFDHRFGVAVPLNSPNDDGLPVAAESEELNQIEDKLASTFEPFQKTVLAVILTTSGFREFVFYTSAPTDIKPAMDIVKTQISSHKLQFYVKPDAEWGVYESYLG